MGKEKNRNALSPNAEGVRRRREEFHAARGSEDIWCIFGLKMLYLARPLIQLGGLGSIVSSPSGSGTKMQCR